MVSPSDPPHVGIQVVRAIPMDQDAASRARLPRPINAHSSKKTESPVWRIGMSVLVGFICSIVNVLVWNAQDGLHWVLAVSGLLLGALLVIPLRSGTSIWKRAWFVRVLPACAFYGLFVGLFVYFGTIQNTDLFPMIVQVILLTTSAVAAGLSNPNEPPPPVVRIMQPADPVWPPDRWTPMQWQQWWDQLCTWNIHRETTRGENVPPLNPPPIAFLHPGFEPTPPALYAWQNWWTQYQQWGILSRPQMPQAAVTMQAAPQFAPAGAGFPPGWASPTEPGPHTCVICRQQFHPDGVARCPGPEYCRSIVCRNCLAQSLEECPVCGHRAH